VGTMDSEYALTAFENLTVSVSSHHAHHSKV
jgi:hypothetical protein